MSFHFSRRSFLQYAPLATAAVAIPVVSLAVEQEEPWTKARRLSKELSEALAECGEGRWYAMVMPKGHTHPSGFAAIPNKTE